MIVEVKLISVCYENLGKPKREDGVAQFFVSLPEELNDRMAFRVIDHQIIVPHIMKLSAQHNGCLLEMTWTRGKGYTFKTDGNPNNISTLNVEVQIPENVSGFWFADTKLCGKNMCVCSECGEERHLLPSAFDEKDGLNGFKKCENCHTEMDSSVFYNLSDMDEKEKKKIVNRFSSNVQAFYSDFQNEKSVFDTVFCNRGVLTVKTSDADENRK